MQASHPSFCVSLDRVFLIWRRKTRGKLDSNVPIEGEDACVGRLEIEMEAFSWPQAMRMIFSMCVLQRLQ